MTPKIVDEKTCRRCGEVAYFTTSMPRDAKCVECGLELYEPEPVVITTGAQWHGVDYLEAGAAQLRDIVAAMKAKKREP